MKPDLFSLLDKYNEPYNLDDHKIDTKRQKIRLEAMKLLPDLLEDMKELNRLFDLQHERTQEADKLWQEENNKPDTKPDLGELIGWLLQKITWQKECIVRQSEELGMKGIQIDTLLDNLEEIKDSLNMRITVEDALETIDNILIQFGRN